MAQVHHDLARVLEIVHLFFQPLQFWIGQIERNADHRLFRRASPFVAQVARRAELADAFGLELPVELLHKTLERGALKLQPKLADGLGEDLLHFGRSFFESLQWGTLAESVA